ncbi:hypothetical protein EG240_03740 [Paenimyroides tangerinum]|uniref:Uncharacterized protein n=1 Tax=Paenimyroides tangerinum TaxID=2488728 RepID=A0A3P3WD66_9FLAO|nr:hypothetical protein [Paenimyroides tangerinum]RRJ92297.1 hypothetical protein EG240_03740 [Paenimyroides tangerinum]
MAGGTITRIALGKSTTVVEENFEGFYQKLTMSSGGISNFNAKKTNHNTPKEEELKEGYFIKGYWSSDSEGRVRINEAYLGDIVYFTIETRNIKDDKFIATRLVDSNYNERHQGKDKSIELGNDDKGYRLINYRKVSKNKVVIKITLSESGILSDLIDKEDDRTVELYFACSYASQNVKLPLGYKDYLKTSKLNIPLIIYQRAFAPWYKFGSLYGILPNSFYGDNRSFSLLENTVEGAKNAKANNKVSSRLYHEIKIVYPFVGIDEKNVKSYASETEGAVMMIGPEDTAHEKPYSEQFFDGDQLIMRVLGQDPLVIPAPNIDCKLDLQFRLDKSTNILNIVGQVFYKAFPAYEAYIEDDAGTKLFLHTFGPLHEELLAWELMDLGELVYSPYNWMNNQRKSSKKPLMLDNPNYDYIQPVEMSIKLKRVNGTLLFDETLIKAKDVFRVKPNVEIIIEDKKQSRNLLQSIFQTASLSGRGSLGLHFTDSGKEYVKQAGGNLNKGLNKVKATYKATDYKDITIDAWNKIHLKRPASEDLDLVE